MHRLQPDHADNKAYGFVFPVFLEKYGNCLKRNKACKRAMSRCNRSSITVLFSLAQCTLGASMPLRASSDHGFPCVSLFAYPMCFLS